MHLFLRRSVPNALSLLLLCALTLFLSHYFDTSAKTEPDTRFYIGLARQTSQTGLIRSLPQAENIGWASHFPETRFLFIQLATLMYRLGGEKAIFALTPFLSFLILLCLFIILRTFVSRSIALMLILCTILCVPVFASRLAIFRPYLLAASFFLVILYGIINSKPHLSMIGTLLFALSYHALYIPLFIIAFCIAFGVICRSVNQGSGERWFKSVLFMIAGLLLGIVLNPYFPENLSLALDSLSFAVAASDIPPYDQALEMQAQSFPSFLQTHLFPLFCFVAGALHLLGSMAEKRNLLAFLKEKDSQSIFFLFFFGLGLWVLTAYCPRGREYAVLVTLVFLGPVFRSLKSKKTLYPATLLLMVVWTGFSAVAAYRKADTTPFKPELVFEAIDHIPKAAEGKKVFNCEWYVPSLLYYRRPDLRFVDISDPTWLKNTSPALFSLRNQLAEGKIAYPYGVIHYAFASDYVLCNRVPIVLQLEKDPHFRRLYPSQEIVDKSFTEPLFFVYEVTPHAITNLAFNFETQQKEPGHWKALPRPTDLPKNQWSPYINLNLADEKSIHTTTEMTTQEKCVTVRPTQDELTHHQGASILGLGGGERIDLSWNKRQLFSSRTRPSKPNWLQILVPLPGKLLPNDELEARVCSRMNSPLFGFALSFWTQDELENTCRHKIASHPTNLPARSLSHTPPFTDRPSRTCLADYAVLDASSSWRMP